MVFTKYSFPNPNNGDRYDLSQSELVELLDKVYYKGFDDAQSIYDPARQGILTWTSSEDIDDNALVIDKEDLNE